MKTNPLRSSGINIVTLGCAKNIVDSEHLAARLRANQIHVQYDADLDALPNLIINTCGFINDAKQESIDVILRAIRAKEQGKIRRLVVMGCLSERYRKELEQEIPEVDEYFGVNNVTDIIRYFGLDLQRELTGGERYLHNPAHYAWLKISEGCDRRCAFCAIPAIRGKHTSVPMENLLKEARFMASEGVKELILIAQDLSSYGVDLYGRKELPALLEKLTEIDGIQWIRLHYLYPAGFPKRIVPVIRNHEKICRYLDLPVQHISDTVLRRMRRGTSGKAIRNLIGYLRHEIPDLTLRTTLIVGHPGEGEKEFSELEAFVREVRFERLGVFSYSHEEGTYGGIHYADEVPGEVKQERLQRIMEIQRDISTEKNQAMIGKKNTVLIDRKEENGYIGRTAGDSPEIDNEVFVVSEQKLMPGSFVPVLITGADAYDLEAVLVDGSYPLQGRRR
jgi:ribosomal protein S12 methylthiotransferase